MAVSIDGLDRNRSIVQVRPAVDVSPMSHRSSRCPAASVGKAGLLMGQARKIAKLDEFRSLRIFLLESCERFVESQYVIAGHRTSDIDAVEVPAVHVTTMLQPTLPPRR
jgi:hypothetical protein